MTANDIILTPVQQTAADGLRAGAALGDVFVLRSKAGMGRTTILRNLHAALGGAFIGMRQLIDTLADGHPAIEESLLQSMGEALAFDDVILVDDVHLVTRIVNSLDYPRSYMLDAALTAILGEAAARKKKLIFGVNEHDAPWPIRRRADSWEIADFDAADCECVCRAYLDAEVADRLDYARIHQCGVNVNAYQLKNACIWLRRETAQDTDIFIQYLRSQNMASNVEVAELSQVD